MSGGVEQFFAYRWVVYIQGSWTGSQDPEMAICNNGRCQIEKNVVLLRECEKEKSAYAEVREIFMWGGEIIRDK